MRIEADIASGMDALSTRTRAASPSASAAGGILIVTDAWHPQVNGVVRTLERLTDEIRARGRPVGLLSQAAFPSVPMPTYPDIRLAIPMPGAVGRAIEQQRARHLHIATEGPLGVLARRYCISRAIPFTTSYHTRFPEYLRARAPVPLSWSYAWLRSFHNAAAATLVATASLADELRGRGFSRIRPWTRGVDMDQFSPAQRRPVDLPRPIHLYVGRVAVEKNIEAFLRLDLPGTKMVVGDGPDLPRLRSLYPGTVFSGRLTGRALAQAYASADVFVFPSRTDTFGIVLLEALASGLPVAAYPVTGPLDVVGDGLGGVVDEDLGTAIGKALQVPRADACRKAALYSWGNCADMFLAEVDRAYSG